MSNDVSGRPAASHTHTVLFYEWGESDAVAGLIGPVVAGEVEWVVHSVIEDSVVQFMVAPVHVSLCSCAKYIISLNCSYSFV